MQKWPTFDKIRHSRLFLTSLHFLKGDIKGIRGHFLLSCSSNMIDGFNMRWDDILLNHKLSFVLTDTYFFSIQIEARGYPDNTWWIYIFYSLNSIVLIFIDLSSRNKVSMIFQGPIEETNSKIPPSPFSSLDMLTTHQLQLYRQVFDFLTSNCYGGNFRAFPIWGS